jgi:WD40 repeat protein
MLQFKNEEIDFLIYFYLQECGFFHSAFVFAHECNLGFLQEKEKLIPPGILISIFQRGLLYTEIENNFSASFFSKIRSPILDFLLENKKKLNYCHFPSRYISFPNIATFLTQKSIQSYIWHPRKINIYIGIVDSSVYLWKIKKSKGSSNIVDIKSVISSSNTFSQQFDKTEITNIDSNLSGTLFVSSTYKGLIIFWSETGKILKKTLFIFEKINDIRWNENSHFIVVGFSSGKAIIFSCWYFQTLIEVYPLNFNLIKINWVSNKSLIFSTDEYLIGNINLLEKKVFEIFAHASRICDIDLYNLKNLIATCSEKGKIRTWICRTSLIMMLKLNAHFKEITVIRWKPNNFCFNLCLKQNIKKTIILSASLDHSIRIWDINNKECIFSFSQNKPVISIVWNIYSYKFLAGFSEGVVVVINCKNYNKKNYYRKIYSRYAIFDIISHSMFNIYFFISSGRIHYW